MCRRSLSLTIRKKPLNSATASPSSIKAGSNRSVRLMRFTTNPRPSTSRPSCAANLLCGVIKDGKFTAGGISLENDDDVEFKEGDRVKLVFRPEDVFLRVAANLTQHYQKLMDGVVREVSFVGRPSNASA